MPLEIITQYATLIIFTAVISICLRNLFSTAGAWSRAVLPAHALLFLAFTAHLAAYSIAQRHCPFASGREAAMFAAWLLTGLMLINVLLCKGRSISVFVLPFAGGLAFLSMLHQSKSDWLPERYSGTLFPLHVSLTMLGFTLYGMVFIMLLLYAKSHSDLKSRRPGFLFGRLPPLETQAKQISLMLVAGNILVPIGLAFGVFWAGHARLKALLDIKLTIACCAWLVFMGITLARKRLSPERACLLALIGFLLVVANFLVGRHAT